MLANINNGDRGFITQDVDAFEDHADDLMDDLFADMEHILHVDNPPPRAMLRLNPAPETQEAKPGDIASDTVSLTKIDLPAVPLPPVSKQDILWIEPYGSSRESELSVPDAKLLGSETQGSSGYFWDRLLPVVACASVLVAAGIWFANRHLLDETVRNASNLTPSLPQLSAETLKFAEEIKRSLTSASTKNSAGLPNTISGSPQFVPMLPNYGQLPVTALNPAAPNIQPIYIPVYQPPGLVNAPAPNAGNAADPKVTTPALPLATAPSPGVPAPVPSYTLVGVLELGDRSSALFDIKGSVQTMRVGTVVGDSGWTLSSVGQQEAVLRRGNETRSVFVGQKF